MTFLPIVDRELRARARRGLTYWNRFSVGLCGVLLCLAQLLGASAFGGVGRAGGNAFDGLVIAAFLICCTGWLFTSDAISWERREGTLGLLFLTRVRGSDVVMGKLASGALASVFALLAFLPVLLLPVLSGGVTGGEGFRKGLVLLDTLFLALAAGLWASARGFEAFRTARVAVAVVLAILLLPLLLSPLAHGPNYAVAGFSPFFGLKAAGDLAYRVSAAPFWISIGAMQLLAWLLVLRTGVRLRNSLQEPERSAGLTIQGTTADSGNATPVRRARFTDAATPVGWLVSRQRGLRVAFWSPVLIGMFSHLGPFYLFRFRPPSWAMVWPMAFATTVITGCLFAWAASRFFLETRKAGELELLMTTPLGAKTIVTEQWNALLRILRLPLLVMLTPFLLQPALMLYQQRGLFGTMWSPWSAPHLINTLLGAANTLLGVVALCWLGMWFGFKSRTQAGAIVRSVLWAKAAPWLLSVGFSFLPIILSTVAFGVRTNLRDLLAFTPPQILVTGFYLWLIKRVKSRLLGELRDAEPASLISNRETMQHSWKNSVSAFHRLRHWTPT